ncbi:hypothetical protein CXG81DRAFT_19397 [Caulochytrium protostelioides]|nr:hypothetical protein CXG81DRAFT_19397 [Caulochytrium protostelioides]|eukprot:RKP00667.1 hypothetical protein CXG81DRAFT_19397 [Caulochytrium protostelioides]
MDSNRQPQVESYQDDEFLEDQSLEDRYGNHKIWDEELAFGIAWHKRHQLELRSFSKQNPFYTTTKAQHKSYMITINAWTARLTDDHNTGIADFQYLVTQSQVNLMKAMMPEEFSKSIVAASTQHLAWCLDPIQDAYHFWQMATFANWMNGFLLSKWSETRYEETYHSLVLHLSPVLPVLEFYGAAFPTISSAVELSMQISRVQQQVFALRAIDKLISQAREKRRRALYAGRSYRKSPAIRFYEGLIQPSHLSQAKQGLHQVAILQVLSRYAIRILPEIQRADTKAKSEMKRDDIYDTWLKLREAHVQEINAAPDGAEMSQAKASTAESSESKPASDEAVLLSNILLCLGLETSQLPDLAVLEDSHGDFLEFYHSLYDLHAPSLRDQMTMVEVRISQAQDSITVFRRQSWIRESMKLGGDRSRSKIIQGALPVLDENAKTFLPKDFRRQKPEHGDGRFPILPSEIHQQVVDLSHFVESVKKLWPPEAWGDSGKTGNFFSSAVIYRATRRIDRKYGQYRVLNQYLKLASGEKR